MSRLKINPPVYTVYPNDRKIFTAESVAPPPYWTNVLNSGDIKSDFSLEVDPAGSQVAGNGAHLLYSGIGIVEITIDNQCLPTSTNTFVIGGFIIDVNGLGYIFSIVIDATSVKVVDEANNTLNTESYSTVAGDVYRLELAAGFRYYRNGVLKFSRTSLGTTVIYPMGYQCILSENTVSAPTRIPPPRLIGDWRLSSGASFAWTVTHGSLTNFVGGIQTEYFGGTTPGNHTLAVTIESAADPTGFQKAIATVTIPPLQILGDTSVTLQPGQKVRFKTNYDAAQTSLIAWSVVSGPGSFSQDEFTAGSVPGVSIIRATASVNGLSADIIVTVPAVVTNANNYTAAKASEQIDFDVNFQTMPSFVSAGVKAEGTANIIPGLPPGIQADDILLLFVESANEVVSTPSGWAIVADSPQGTGTGGGATATRLSVFWKRATPVETAPTVTDPGDHAIAQILAFRGCINTGNPWDVTSGNTGASSTSVSIPGDTTTVANCLVVLAVSNITDTATPQTSGYTNADLANLTERTDINTTQGNGGGFAVITGEKASIGAYTTTTATLANASEQGRISIALKPGTITWSASIGSINSSSGLWTAPSQTGQTARIVATNGTYSITLQVPVLNVFPLSDPTLPLSWDRNLTALVAMSEDRKRRTGRRKSPAFDSYPIKFTSRTLSECDTVDAFFDSHGFDTLFIFEDKLRSVRKVGWFDSPIRHEARDECDIDLAFQFLEARL